MDDPNGHRDGPAEVYRYSSWSPKNTTSDCRRLIFLTLELQLIARSSALKTVFMEQRNSRLITEIELLLRREKSENAVAEAIHGRDFCLQDGEPRHCERVDDCTSSSIGLLFLLVTFSAYVLWMLRVQEKCRAMIVSHSDKLDRVHGEMLKNRLKADSCPICLEAFNVRDERGTDGLPLEIIRCGHCFCTTCWRIWKEKVTEESLKCLICRKPVKRSRCRDLGATREEEEPNDFPFFCLY